MRSRTPLFIELATITKKVENIPISMDGYVIKICIDMPL